MYWIIYLDFLPLNLTLNVQQIIFTFMIKKLDNIFNINIFYLKILNFPKFNMPKSAANFNVWNSAPWTVSILSTKGQGYHSLDKKG